MTTIRSRGCTGALGCYVKHRAMLIVDPPAAWSQTHDEISASDAKARLGHLGLNGGDAGNAAIYFPRVRRPDALRADRIGSHVPCGIVAGVMARTDGQRGVWKAPAGADAQLVGISGLDQNLNDGQNAELNRLGINCLRHFQAGGPVVWGALTMRGADRLADEYKYIPVRRTALFIEESLYRGLRWAVFEPNEDALWSRIRLSAGVFIHGLFRQGAFQGATPREAYYVKCGQQTTTSARVSSTSWSALRR